MKYYKLNNEVFAYEEDGSQDNLIGDKALMTAEEVEAHINPPKTEEQLKAEKLQEAKAYLASTDHKFYGDYEPKENETEEVLAEIKVKRSEARTFIRANQ